MELKHPNAVRFVALSRDAHTAVTGCTHDTVRVWDLRTRDHFVLATFMPLHQALFLAACPNKVILVPHGGDAQEWDLHTRLPSAEAFEWPHTHVVSEDGLVALTWINSKTLLISNALTFEPIAQLDGHTDAIRSAVLSWDGRLALTRSMDRSARVWNARTGRVIKSYWDDPSQVGAAAIAHDGRMAASSGAEDVVYVFDLRTAKTPRVFPCHTSLINCMKFSMDGNTLITGSDDKTSRVWDCTAKWKLEQWALLSTPRWDAEMGRELSHFF